MDFIHSQLVEAHRWPPSPSFHGAQLSLRPRPFSVRLFPPSSSLLPHRAISGGDLPCCDEAGLITGSRTVCGSRYVIILQPGGRSSNHTEQTSAPWSTATPLILQTVQVFKRCHICLNTSITLGVRVEEGGGGIALSLMAGERKMRTMWRKVRRRRSIQTRGLSGVRNFEKQPSWHCTFLKTTNNVNV